MIFRTWPGTSLIGLNAVDDKPVRPELPRNRGGDLEHEWAAAASSEHEWGSAWNQPMHRPDEFARRRYDRDVERNGVAVSWKNDPIPASNDVEIVMSAVGLGVVRRSDCAAVRTELGAFRGLRGKRCSDREQQQGKAGPEHRHSISET